MRLDGFGLLVNDMGIMIRFQYENAISKGATPVLEPITEPWGQRTCYIADPEGNLIEIGSWNKSFETKDK